MEAEGRAPDAAAPGPTLSPTQGIPFIGRRPSAPLVYEGVGLATRAVVVLRSAGIDLIRSGVECGDGR